SNVKTSYCSSFFQYPGNVLALSTKLLQEKKFLLHCIGRRAMISMDSPLGCVFFRFLRKLFQGRRIIL
ncbi:hypothetical protein, partial [Phascolarctobacterium faecium]|uniref:hypothetical protein n=1 Tax=Phascolarctobacterium faecium TaxID=33025 RepID=UPI003C6E7588